MDNSTSFVRGISTGRFSKSNSAGRRLYDFMKMSFAPTCAKRRCENEDLPIHEGRAVNAQKFAAKVFNRDKTYFVLNGTSAANKVLTKCAVDLRGDPVLFDRNNHKSNHRRGRRSVRATPVYRKPRATRSALSAAHLPAPF
ncbi:hypothetical protein MJ561_24690 [Klebsiella pneumoniae]|nr:hypothetical protein MJ561_24690 [Klebsiella pneumoniae]